MLEKLKNRLLDLNYLIKKLGFKAFLSSYSTDLRFKIMEKPRAGRILVFAPHPDDEIFGCGGVLAKHIMQKDKVKIIIMTRQDDVRTNECKKANKLLGVNDIEYFNFTDQNLSANNEEVSRIKRAIKEFRPKIIYAPFFHDSHTDHRHTAIALAKAVKNRKKSIIIYSYEIWTPLQPNRIIEITNVITMKKLAIKEYQSQLKERDYLPAIIGLNEYRAGMSGAGKQAEAFFACRGELYCKLVLES